MKIAVVRGAFLNNFEMQNYEPLAKRHEIVGFSSLRPLHDKFSLPVIKLPSPMDFPIPNQRLKMAVLNRLFVDAHYLWGLEEKLRGFDIAHAAETYYRYTQQCLNAKKKGYVKKVVAVAAENIPFNNERIRGRKEFKKRAIEEVDHFLALTEGAKNVLVKEGCDEKKITIIPTGINLKKFRVKNKELRIKGKRNLEILFVGRLEEEKGIMELLEAFRQLSREVKGQRLILRIVGSGSLHDYIVRRGEEWGISEKIIIETKDYDEISEVYNRADIFVFPSKPSKFWREQLGMVLIEAMACGLPIVTTTSGSIPEVVGKDGILVDPGNSRSLFDGLKRLVKNQALCQELGKKGRRRAETYFDSQKIAQKIEAVYLSL